MDSGRSIMEIYISRDEQRFGPYTIEQVREYLAAGQLVADDLAWHEGVEGWISLGKVRGLSLAERPSLLPTVLARSEVAQVRGGAGRPWRSFALPVLALALVMVGAVFAFCRFLPGTTVVAGRELAPADRQALLAARVMEAGETVRMAVPAPSRSLREAGSILTDRRVIAYQKNAGESRMAVASARLAEVTGVEVDYGGREAELVVVSVSVPDDEFLIVLAAGDKGQRRFAEELKEAWKAARSMSVRSGKAAR